VVAGRTAPADGTRERRAAAERDVAEVWYPGRSDYLAGTPLSRQHGLRLGGIGRDPGAEGVGVGEALLVAEVTGPSQDPSAK
jgi:hypothetical protein